MPIPPMPEIRPVRLMALDHLRGFIILLVVLHHAVLGYCSFGHVDHRHYTLSTVPVVDPRRWVGFDALVTLNDGFFMPLLFLLSGLFVWGGLSGKGGGSYLQARLLRLGLPFAVAELTIVPLAYYPSFLQAGGKPGFGAFWTKTVTAGPWPSGPPWFAAILLLFDAAATLAFLFAGRPAPGQPARHYTTPSWWFALLLAGSLFAYLPLLAAFGPTLWLSVGPLAVQGSRTGLYAAYFIAGILLGTQGTRDSFPLCQLLAQRWPRWGLLAVLAGTVFVLIATRQGYGILTELPPWLGMGLLGTALATFCATAAFALMALFFRYGGNRVALAGSLAANSYGIYLLHYPAVTWMQYGLLRVSAGAVTKAATTFAVALLVSWGGAILLRRLPGVRHVV